MRLLVLGGGPAGVNAAVQGRALGAEVTLIEAKRVGGTSLNEGPAPVRTLARTARLVRDARSWHRFGLRGDGPQVDLEAAVANANRVVNYAHEEMRLADLIRVRGVDLVDGRGPAVFVDPRSVRMPDGSTYSGDAIVIAVGGRAGRLPIPGAELALTYEDVRQLRSLPRSLAVVGGADTGCQLASILGDLGAQVTLIEASSQLLPRADNAIAQALASAFLVRGIAVWTSTLVERLEGRPGGVRVHHRRDGESGQLDVEAVFFAVGWPGNADTIGADAVGVRTHRGYVEVDACLRSSLPHIFAAGDVNGISMLVPSARQEGRVAAENAVVGSQHRYNHQVTPTGSFTDPEYGSVGLTESEAREHYDCEVAVARYDYLVRPVVDDRVEGFCKLVVDKRERTVLGVHMVGEYSAEVVQMAAACMSAKMRVEEIAQLQPAFPTFTEAVEMAAQQIVHHLGMTAASAIWTELTGNPTGRKG
jgi:pyruvate/2-oxoglutarate dehydrogenase complex dihydrolipoamide dehydrogenase (E3) component